MRRQKRLIDELFLLVLAVGWLWAVGTTSTVFAQNDTKLLFKNLLPEAYLQNRVGFKKTVNKNMTMVAGIKTSTGTKTINRIHRPVLPPLKDRPYWPYRQGIDCSIQKCVALTFDDGPSNGTGQLLDVLKSKNAKATFFVVGDRVQGDSNVVKRMIAEHHEIGNHSLTHKWNRWTSTQTIADEINATQQIIFGVTGYKPHIFRPPYGNFPANDPTITQYPIILWNADPDDWKHRNITTVNQEVTRQVKTGSIVIMHDIYPTTVSAITPIVDELKSQNYELVTITELMGWKDALTPLPKGQVIRHR